MSAFKAQSTLTLFPEYVTQAVMGLPYSRGRGPDSPVRSLGTFTESLEHDELAP